MFDLKLLAHAEDEFSEAFDWYQKQQTGLGKKFFTEVNQQLTLIEANPYHYPIRYANVLHAVPVKKFPFIIIYWVDDAKQQIVVASIFHTSRQPKY
ncbi:MAG: type II toxin-antitoxin system RelE/ParE family toxin [Mucilaginibacter sp.]